MIVSPENETIMAQAGKPAESSVVQRRVLVVDSFASKEEGGVNSYSMSKAKGIEMDTA